MHYPASKCLCLFSVNLVATKAKELVDCGTKGAFLTSRNQIGFNGKVLTNAHALENKALGGDYKCWKLSTVISIACSQKTPNIWKALIYIYGCD